MARKRNAADDLNHDNWEDYETEEAGTFKRAPSNILEGRIIKTAKRRNPISSVNSESATKHVFSSFGGFNKSTTQSSPFAFLTNMTDSETKANGVGTTTTVSSAETEPTSKSILKLSENKPTNSVESTSNSKTEKSVEYYSKLKGLNEGVTEWIKIHVDKNPLCILTPVFKDYEKHLLEIEEAEKGITDKTKTESTSTFSSDIKTTKSATPPLSSSSNLISKPNELNKSANAEENIQSTAVSSVASKLTFSFGTLPSSTTISAPTGFSFGSGQPFTFSNVIKPETTENSSTNDADEEDEPPKVEFKRVVEDGSIFSKRCKVFVKKDGSFGDRGVGHLFLKPVPGSEKIQLVVRADTNLGNLLLNFILSESIPIQRMGKNNVMLVSIPTPESKPPPAPILLRVKTAEEADELLKVLEKHKK